METLSGYSISQFQVFGQSDRISADDRFFTSQPINYIATYREYESKALEYNLLMEQIFNDLSAAFGFGSMAYELSDAYSRAQHVHQYNSFDIKSDYGISDDTTMLATFKVDDKIVRLCMPRQWVYVAPDPVIGELKYKMLPTITRPDTIDINSTNFDGWVYPRGQSYKVASTDFLSAKDCFGLDRTATILTIPNINNFVKAVPSHTSALTVHFENTGIPRHSHSSSVQLGGGVYDNYKLSAVVTRLPGSGGALHNGKKGFTPPKYYKSTLVFNASLSVDKSSIEIGQSESYLDREQYPSYNYLPIMIYIGKKNQ